MKTKNIRILCLFFDLTKDCGCTWHAFGECKDTEQIDYIYADCATASRKYEITIWKDEMNGIYLSDHYPVSLSIKLA